MHKVQKTSKHFDAARVSARVRVAFLCNYGPSSFSVTQSTADYTDGGGGRKKTVKRFCDLKQEYCNYTYLCSTQLHRIFYTELANQNSCTKITTSTQISTTTTKCFLKINTLQILLAVTKWKMILSWEHMLFYLSCLHTRKSQATGIYTSQYYTTIIQVYSNIA